jgi:hypothetical protein
MVPQGIIFSIEGDFVKVTPFTYALYSGNGCFKFDGYKSFRRRAATTPL